MNAYESIDFDFFDSGKSSEKGRPFEKPDYPSDDDWQSNASSARSAASAVKKIEAKLPTVTCDVQDSGSESSSDEILRRRESELSPCTSSRLQRGQGSSTSDSKLQDRDARISKAKLSSSNGSRQAWSDESLPADRTYETRHHGDQWSSGFHRKKKAEDDGDGRGHHDYVSDATTTNPSSRENAQIRESPNGGYQQGLKRSSLGVENKFADIATDPDDITWDTDSDVTVSPLDSRDNSPLISPRDTIKRATTVSIDLDGLRPPNKTNYSVNHVPAQQKNSRDERASLDEDKMNLNILLKALLDCEDKPAKGKKQVVLVPPDFDTEQSARLSETSENRKLLQNLLGLPSTLKKDRSLKSKTSHEMALSRVTNASVNRAKEQRRIEMENLALLKRLQSAKPTRELQRKAQLQDYYRQLSYHAPQLRGGDSMAHGLGTTSASPATCYGTKLYQKSESLQSLRSSASSQRSTARLRPASATRERVTLAEKGTGVGRVRPPQSQQPRARSGAPATTQDSVEERAEWENGW